MIAGLQPRARHRRLSAALLASIALAALSAGTARAETLTVTDLVLPQSDALQLSVPSVTVVDGNLTEQQVRDLFSGGPEALAALATIDAARVEIPEIVFTQSLPATGLEDVPFSSSTTTYRDFLLVDVADGVAASASVGATDMTAGETSLGSFGAVTTGRFDIGQLMAFYGLIPRDGREEMREVYSDFRFEGGSVDYGVLACDIGPMTSGSFEARAPETSWIELFDIIGELQAAEQADAPPSPEAVKTLIDFYIDFLTAFRSEPVSLESFECVGGETNEQVNVSAGPLYAGSYEPGTYPDFGLDDLAVDMGAQGSVTLGGFIWKPMDLNGPIEALRSAPVLDEAWFAANWRKLIPAMDGFALESLDFDVAGEGDAPRTSGSLGGLDVSLDAYVNGIPSDISITVADLDTAVPPGPPEPGAPDLLALGIERLLVDFATHVRWDEAAGTVVFDELMLDVADLGRVALSGTLGNATPALFGEDMAAAEAAAMQLTFKTLDLHVTDYGLGGIAVAMGAQEAGQPPEGFRTALAGMVQGMTLAFLGNSPEALQAAIGIGNFLAGSPELHLTLTALDEAGIGLDVLAQLESNPAALAGRVAVTAEATGEPLPVPELPPTPAPAEESPAPPADESPAADSPPPPAEPPAPVEQMAPTEQPAPPGSVQDQKRDLKAPAGQ